MQLYRTFYTIPDTGPEDNWLEACCWQASQTEASKTRTRLKTDGHKKIGTQTVNVPTAKGPLLEWLNENITTA